MTKVPTRSIRGICSTAALGVVLLALAASAASATDFVVTKTADTNDGACNSDCSLREAIIAANASAGADRIILTAGQTYPLTLGPADAAGALVPGTGDLDVTDALTIEGNGSTIDAGQLDRVFDIQGAFTVTINGLQIQNGLASGFLAVGGGISIRSATVILNNCTVSGNATAADSDGRDNGGGIAVVGSFDAATGTPSLASLTLNNTLVLNNTAAGGGGVVCVLCALTVSGSTLQTNTASGRDGAGIEVVGNSSTLSIARSTLSTNTANSGGRGGGLAVPFGSSVSTLTRSRIVANSGSGGSGATFNGIGTITATNNWWGCNYGPGATGGGCASTPNAASGAATTSPYLVLKASASPATLVAGGISTVVGDLTFNSSNADTAAGGTVPNGIVAAFSGTLGTFASGTAQTSNGKATNTYTAGGSPGVDNVSIVVDSQTVSAAIQLLGTPPAFTANPSDKTPVVGTSATFTVAATGNPSPGYAWQMSTNGGTSWSAVPNAAPYSGVATAALTVSNVTPSQTGYEFRALASNTAGTATSGFATLFVDTSIDDRLVLGLGPYSSDGGWGAARKGTAGSLDAATWLHLPWADYNATGGGLHLAAGDVDGDGLDEVIAGLGPGGGGWIAIFDDAQHGYALLRWIRLTWTDYNAANGEVWPAAGDLDGDGRAEIVAGLGQGGQGYLEIFDDASANFSHVAWRQVGWPAYNAGASGATHPAIGNLDGVGAAEIVLGLGTGSEGYLEIVGGAAENYTHRTWLQIGWPAYNAANGTAFPAAGDVDGDGRAEIVVGLGNGGAGWLERFEDAAAGFAHAGWLRTSWSAYNDTSTGETHPALGNLDGDPRAEIAIGLGVFPGDGGWFEVYDDAATGFAGLGWRNVSWAPFGAAGGATYPAIGRLK